MKPVILLVPFAAVSAAVAAFQADLGAFEPILKALAELPLVVGMAWILMRQQDRHQQTIDRIMNHFSNRSEQKDALYRVMLDNCLKTIEELAKK